jgi:hypothetical protein
MEELYKNKKAIQKKWMAFYFLPLFEIFFHLIKEAFFVFAGLRLEIRRIL